MIPGGGASRSGGCHIIEGKSAAGDVTRWLGLAATPTFAIMAALTSDLGGGATEFVCSAAPDSLLSGMAAMYVLMSAFHAAPWLKLLNGWRN